MLVFVLWHHLTLHIINTLLARKNDGIVHRVVRLDEAVEHGFFPCQQINILVTTLFPTLLAVLAESALGVHVEVQVPSECLSHNGSERTADELQRVLELNAAGLDLHLLLLNG